MGGYVHPSRYLAYVFVQGVQGRRQTRYKRHARQSLLVPRITHYSIRFDCCLEPALPELRVMPNFAVKQSKNCDKYGCASHAMRPR